MAYDVTLIMGDGTGPELATAALRALAALQATEDDPAIDAEPGKILHELRRGKANKIIAYDLNLCQSTVKVHIRNIMKKVGATNRTEVAYKLRELQRA